MQLTAHSTAETLGMVTVTVPGDDVPVILNWLAAYTTDTCIQEKVNKSYSKLALTTLHIICMLLKYLYLLILITCK